MKFVIEHLEPRLSRWVKLEYSSISKMVGKANLIFSNVRKTSPFLTGLGSVMKESITDRPLPKMIILDPESKVELCPADAKKFDYLVFGGILGDYPPRKRTWEDITSKIVEKRIPHETRNLGPVQMSTDTAVRVATMVCEGKRLSEIEYADEISIELAEGEAVDLPYRYVVGLDGNPILPSGLVEYLKKKRSF